MVSLQQIKDGLASYLEYELLSRFTGWQKWTIGAALSMYLEKSTDIFNNLKARPEIQALEVIDQDDYIDIDNLYKHFLAQAKKGAITFNVPFIGAVTLKADDVELLYKCIKEAK